jgi:hypothetical protein
MMNGRCRNICAYPLSRNTRVADSPEYLEIAKERKAGAASIVLLAKGLALAP